MSDKLKRTNAEALESMSSPRGKQRGMGSILSNASQVFILTDENVAPFWLPEVEYWCGEFHIHCLVTGLYLGHKVRQ